MCNKVIQQIRYRSALMHFPVHLKISWTPNVIEVATIERSPSEQQKPVKIRDSTGMVSKYVPQIAEWMEQCSDCNIYNKTYIS